MNNIFQYIQDKKGKPIPLKYKLLNNIPLTESDLFVNGDLLLFRTNLTSLPDNLTVNGNMSLLYSKIKSLPNNLTVKGTLDIRCSNISELPDDLYVDFQLWCIKTPLAKKIIKEKSLLKKYKQQVKGKICYE